MKRTILYIAIFASGLGLGALVQRELTQAQQSRIDKEWQRLFGEEGSHQRIMMFEETLTGGGIAKDLPTLAKQLETQLLVEDLIIKSREAEYAKITPLGAILVPLLSAIAGGIITAVFGGRIRRSGV